MTEARGLSRAYPALVLTMSTSYSLLCPTPIHFWIMCIAVLLHSWGQLGLKTILASIFHGSTTAYRGLG